MEAATTTSRSSTLFWIGLAMIGPPSLALCVRALWSAMGAEPAHGIAIDLPAALPAWSHGSEVVTAGLSLSASQLVGALGLVAFATLLRRQRASR